ncbi:hypothetical protein IP90_01059 [Luteimonas cucumeris]|uniref:Uncharacterized protein n=1 Tax=Luteimonas cucumeris TaxID=985012 RepID=A0A562LB81_9GAMM|nr:hypothetical protein IP90_01059 [Luteimonas cucumeris]
MPAYDSPIIAGPAAAETCNDCAAAESSLILPSSARATKKPR